MPTNFDNLPEAGLLRQRDLLSGIVPFSSVTLWRKVRDGTFPKPIKLNEGRVTCWRVGDIREWLAAQGHVPKMAA